jgi:hypothetical protein
MFTIYNIFPDWLVDRLLLAGSPDLIPAGVKGCIILSSSIEYSKTGRY